MENYLRKIYYEAKAFDKQVLYRKKLNLIPDIKNLKKNNNFYNNPWREPKFFEIKWMPIINKIINEINKSKIRKNILEVGCGTGFLSLELARKKNFVTGIDLSSESIILAKKYLNKRLNKKIKKYITYIKGDANNYNFKKKYDYLIFYRSLHHFNRLDKLFKNLIKYLNPNCKIIICEPLRKNFTRNNAIFANILRLSLPTWQSFSLKLPKKIDNKFIKYSENKILKEYKYKSKNNKFVQSPMDNSTDNPKKLLKSVRKFFSIKKIVYYDAFIDKIIGGLRGPNRFILATLLKEFDNYLIKEKIVSGSTIFLSGKLK